MKLPESFVLPPDEAQNDTDFVKWDAKFELGIEAIDAQHKKLVDLCNTLHREVMINRASGKSDWHDSLKAALKECADYVLVHFRDEEVLMKGANYANYAEHKHSHELFTQKVLETVRRFNSLSMSDALQFVRFLYQWIFTHIAYEDKLFAKPVIDYLKAKRVIK